MKKKKKEVKKKKRLVNVMRKRAPFMDKFAKRTGSSGFGHSRGV